MIRISSYWRIKVEFKHYVKWRNDGLWEISWGSVKILNFIAFDIKISYCIYFSYVSNFSISKTTRVLASLVGFSRIYVAYGAARHRNATQRIRRERTLIMRRYNNEHRITMRIGSGQGRRLTVTGAGWCCGMIDVVLMITSCWTSMTLRCWWVSLVVSVSSCWWCKSRARWCASMAIICSDNAASWHQHNHHRNNSPTNDC